MRSAILESARRTAREWVRHQLASARALAAAPEMRAAAADLAEAASDRRALLDSPARITVHRCLAADIGTRDGGGFVLVGPGNVVLAASVEAAVGGPSPLPEPIGALVSPRGGESRLLLHGAAPGPGTTTRLYVVAPIGGVGQAGAALLALGTDPAAAFAEMFAPGSGRDGALLAFDREGRILTSAARGAVGQPGVRALPRAGTSDATLWDESLGIGLALVDDPAGASELLRLTGRVLAALTGLSMLLVVGILLMRRRSRQLETLVDGAPVGMLLVDRQGLIRRTNPTAARVFGYTPEELLGLPVDRLLPEPLRAGHARQRMGFHQSPRTRPMGAGLRLEGERRDGARVPLEIALSNVRVAGEPLVLAMLWDIATRLEMERALHERSEELARSNHDLEQFAYVASHDLRAPLRGIAQLADWLAEDLASQASAESKSYLDLVRSRVRRMDALLTSLLEYARASRGLHGPESVDVARLLHDVESLLEWPPGFRLVIEGELPVLCTDSTALRQVFLNLVGNAIKHHDRGEGTVVVGWCRGDVDEFRVSDDGPGIPRTLHDKAFQMFQTLRSRDEVEGSGMGLALVQRVVERRGGRVWIEPDSARGATIRFTWPDETRRRSIG